MDGDTVAQGIWFAGALALVLSSLAVRRIAPSDMVKMAAAWIGIFAGLFLIVTLWKMVVG